MKDYTDYYQFSWNYTPPPLPRLVLPTILSCFTLISFFAYHQLLLHGFDRIDLTTQRYFYGYIAGLTFITITPFFFILKFFIQQRNQRQIQCTINKQGLHLGRHVIKFQQFPQSIITTLQQQQLPKSQWSRQTQSVALKIQAKNKKTYFLRFNTQYSAQHVVTSLIKYLTKNAAT